MSNLIAQVDTSPAEPLRVTQTFKRILVHVDRDRASDRRVDTAINLASKFGAKISGTYVARPILPPAIVMGALPPAFLADEAAQNEREAKEAKRRYRDHVGRHGLDGGWHYLEEATLESFRRISHYMDLAVIGQRDPDVPEELLTI